MHVGESGNGQVAKICNNMAMAINMAGCAEAFNLAVQQGLDPQAVHGTLNSSSGGSWISEVYGCVPGLVEGSPSNNGYNGGFGNALLLKDIRLAREASGVVGAPTPMASVTESLWLELCEAGHSHLDQGSVFGMIYQAQSDKQDH